ncbi:MAG TPA: ABC transporter substrate-binding protein [Gemmatimonadales bacterium]
MTLLPAATEIVAALGAEAELVGISHECDFPESVQHLPRVTATPIDATQPGAAIDAQVRVLHQAGHPVIAVDIEQLRRLAPELMITQGLCEVCAVADGEVYRLSSALSQAPQVLSLNARTLAGVWDDIRTVGLAIDRRPQAEDLIDRLERRLARLAASRPSTRRRLVCVEWLEPLYLAGHWVPDQIAAAGAEDVGAAPGSHSTRRDWEELASLRPDLVVVALCGFGVERARGELDRLGGPAALRVLTDRPVWIVDGNAYTSRPGPRVVDGAERLQAALLGREMPGLARWTAVQ